MPNDTVSAAAEGLPVDPATPRGPLTCSIDLAKLHQMNMRELHALWKALHTVGEVLNGLSCQPRFWNGDDEQYNSAGDLLETVADFLAVYQQAIVNVATEAKSDSVDDAEWRGWVVLGADVARTDDLATASVLAAEMARDEARARFAEAHPRE